MEIKRKPFQGVLNIVRFNRLKYLLSGFLIVFLLSINSLIPPYFQFISLLLVIVIGFFITFSLLISYLIYDCSSLYQLKWIPDLNSKDVLNINAGFDEVSGILQGKSPSLKLTISDFFNLQKHTERAIRRARAIYPILPNTIAVDTHHLPFSDHSFDYVIAFFSAHEIRDKNERVTFFKEINRVLKPGGKIYVTEHLRDVANFIPYSIGFFHFYPKNTWIQTFTQSNLKIDEDVKITPFVTTFILSKDGDIFKN